MSSAGGSFTHIGLHVGSDWRTRCTTYDDSTPILSIDAGDTVVSFSVAGRAVTEKAVAFAHALVRDVEAFAAEVERMQAAISAGLDESADQAA